MYLKKVKCINCNKDYLSPVKGHATYSSAKCVFNNIMINMQLVKFLLDKEINEGI